MTQVVNRKVVRAGICFLNTASWGTVRVAFNFFKTNLQKRYDGAGNSLYKNPEVASLASANLLNFLHQARLLTIG